MRTKTKLLREVFSAFGCLESLLLSSCNSLFACFLTYRCPCIVEHDVSTFQTSRSISYRSSLPFCMGWSWIHFFLRLAIFINSLLCCLFWLTLHFVTHPLSLVSYVQRGNTQLHSMAHDMTLEVVHEKGI